MSEQPPLPLCVCLTAPTASGKTDLAFALAEELPLEIVSMDSAMVYRGLDIGTAKPTAAQRETVPHHLIDVVDPTHTYSAGQFARDARSAIGAIRARGKLPLVVGGTMLYLRALRDGLASLPGRDEALRASLDEQAQRIGWPAMHAKLTVLDPEAAARIAPQDRQRIQRALEVQALTGQTLSALHESQKRTRLPMLRFALVPEDRAELAARVERRFDQMVGTGLVEEVRTLMSRGDLNADMASMRSVGYRQVWGHLAGEYDWPEARRQAIVATRRLAKRQLTWLRGEPGLERYPALDRGLVADLVSRVRSSGIVPA
jgi:tRNA dimethylallyltransferase